VADEFKKKYYDVLSNNPRFFARFFKEDSALTVSIAEAQPQSGSGPEVRRCLLCVWWLLVAVVRQ